jgi:hypothetical protein
LCKVNEVELDQSLGIQSAVMAALLVVGGLDCRPRIGGFVTAEGLGQGECFNLNFNLISSIAVENYN